MTTHCDIGAEHYKSEGGFCVMNISASFMKCYSLYSTGREFRFLIYRCLKRHTSLIDLSAQVQAELEDKR